MALRSSGPLASATERPAGPPIQFPNFMELPRYLPAWAWRVLRVVSVLVALGLAALLWRRPDVGLPVFWGLVVPVLPLVFMMTPGLWRNLCPLATSNQMPRRLGIGKGLAQKSLAQGTAYPIGITLLIGAVIARRLVFNLSGPATAGLILAAMGAAFLGGLLFKGKSGWCSSVCPLLPVQRLYGQTPFIKIANTQCDTCVGCAKNCYDFNPGVAYLADQYDPNPNYRNFRRFFASVFPGLILGYYLVPGVDVIGASGVVLQMLLYMAGSLTAFTLLDLVVGATRNALPVLSAALAINLYYWFAAPLMSKVLTQLGVHPDLTLVGALRAAVAIGSLVWVGRSLQVEHLFLRDQVRRSGAGEIRLAPVVLETMQQNHHVVAAAVAEVQAAASQEVEAGPVVAESGVIEAVALPSATSTLTATPTPTPTPPAAATAAGGPTAAARRGGLQPGVLRIEPSGLTAKLSAGSSLLDLLEGCGADITAGCRAGACGADPVAITAGADCLSTIGDTECATLARLGHAPNTRLACMARVRRAGALTLELQPHAAGAAAPAVEAVENLITQPAALADPSDAQPDSARPDRPEGAPTLRTAVARMSAQSCADPANDSLKVHADVRRVVIVGNGIAGLSAAEELRRLHPRCEIDLISREQEPAYNRVALSSLITKRSGMLGLYLKPDRWYAEQRITHWLNTRAEGLDTDRQEVTLATGETLGYDRLILATGAAAWIPPIEGFGVSGCHVLRQAHDAMALRAHVQQREVRRAVVVGAGLLGLEAAAALRELQLDVSVLSLNDRVLDQQIDATASRLVCEHLARQGVEVLTHAHLRAVERDDQGRVRSLRLQDGRSLAAEVLLLCVGMRPDLELARAGGLAVGKGITVDARMRTSARHVFAAGDAAEFAGRVHGLWGVAADQGRVAATSALGLPGVYQPVLPVTTLKLRGIQVRSAGVPEAQGARQRALLLPPAPGDDADTGAAHTKLVVDGDQVIGAVIVGHDAHAEDLLKAASLRADLSSLRAVLAERESLGGARGAFVAQHRVA